MRNDDDDDDDDDDDAEMLVHSLKRTRRIFWRRSFWLSRASDVVTYLTASSIRGLSDLFCT